VLLGVAGTVVVGHGAADAEDVAACLDFAATSFRGGTGDLIAERHARYLGGSVVLEPSAAAAEVRP
jgi:fatty acid/phospholipid biosynthesis enzyme